jgi:hypothetical protein
MARRPGRLPISKKLERGPFIWPSPVDGMITITPAQLGYLLQGIDGHMPRRTWRPTATAEDFCLHTALTAALTGRIVGTRTVVCSRSGDSVVASPCGSAGGRR